VKRFRKPHAECQVFGGEKHKERKGAKNTRGGNVKSQGKKNRQDQEHPEQSWIQIKKIDKEVEEGEWKKEKKPATTWTNPAGDRRVCGERNKKGSVQETKFGRVTGTFQGRGTLENSIYQKRSTRRRGGTDIIYTGDQLNRERDESA